MKQILKKYLPEQLVIKLARTLDNLKFFKKTLISKSALFLFFDMSMSSHYLREHRAHIVGAVAYEKKIKNAEENIYYIRRNIHRLEKGLLMRPRRASFGLRFILSTVESYGALVNSTNVAPQLRSELQWAHDVLLEYFETVKSDNKEFEKAKRLFLEQKNKKEITNKSEIPFINEKRSNISYDELFLLSHDRKSVRWFYQDKQVKLEDIEKALEIALLAPSSCNRQPFKYYVTTEKQKAVKLAKISAGTVGWDHNIPALVVLVGRQRAFPNILNRHSIYVDSTLSVMPFIFALETLGLSSCIINWADDKAREKEMTKNLNLEKDEKVILSIAIGYADDTAKVAFSKRKNIGEVLVNV